MNRNNTSIVRNPEHSEFIHAAILKDQALQQLRTQYVQLHLKLKPVIILKNGMIEPIFYDETTDPGISAIKEMIKERMKVIQDYYNTSLY